MRLAWIALVAGCGRYWVCDLEDPDRTAELPSRLSETGLYADLASRTLADGVTPYTPKFELWSDGAAKERWIALPAGAAIDTTDMDEWSFPPGTKVWKQFTVDGTLVETRLLERRGDDWIPLAYVWQDDGLDAVATPLGFENARGTDHDVPAAGECVACHGGRRSFVLGYSAIQLDLAAVPGSATEVAALGYLHANCSHCHNQTRPSRDGARCFDPDNSYDFTLAVDSLATVDDTPTYRTVVGQAEDEVLSKMSARGFLKQMPPLATEKVDTEGLARIRAWIAGLR